MPLNVVTSSLFGVAGRAVIKLISISTKKNPSQIASVVEDRSDTATLWFRLRKRNGENPGDRRFVKVGPASKAEIRHVKRARRLWAQHEGMNFSLYTVQAKDVLALRGALGKADGRRVFLKLDAEVIYSIFAGTV